MGCSDYIKISNKLPKMGDSLTDNYGNCSANLLPAGKFLMVVIGEPLKYSVDNFRIINMEEGRNIINNNIKLTKLGSISGKKYNVDGVSTLYSFKLWKQIEVNYIYDSAKENEEK